MQCHNTDVILSARFSNKLEPQPASCGKMNSVHEETWALQEMEERAQLARGKCWAGGILCSSVQAEVRVWA